MCSNVFGGAACNLKQTYHDNIKQRQQQHPASLNRFFTLGSFALIWCGMSSWPLFPQRAATLVAFLFLSPSRPYSIHGLIIFCAHLFDEWTPWAYHLSWKHSPDAPCAPLKKTSLLYVYHWGGHQLRIFHITNFQKISPASLTRTIEQRCRSLWFDFQLIARCCFASLVLQPTQLFKIKQSKIKQNVLNVNILRTRNGEYTHGT